MPTGIKSWLWSGASFAPTSGVPLTDRGFRYGMSLFESLRIHNGIPLLLDEHLSLLLQSCQYTGFTPPPGAIPACASLLTGLPDAFARIYITAGDGPITAPLDNTRLFIFIEPRTPIPPRVYHRGYDLATHPVPHTPLFPGLKTGNYWPNVRAFNTAVANQSNEALLFSPDNLLISASMANVFAVIDGKILTPVSYLSGDGAAATCRPGVVREWVMRTFPAQARESPIPRADLDNATELFLTSSWLGIMPVASLDGRKLAHTISSTVLAAYHRDFNLP
jgi:branched-subunit amino acid aminotransferase/4-amino-4-deoxychorismate lyase